MHHFADNLHFISSAKNLDRLVSHDMENLSIWLSANKFPQNLQKTELVILKQKEKKGKYFYMKYRLSRIGRDSMLHKC